MFVNFINNESIIAFGAFKNQLKVNSFHMKYMKKINVLVCFVLCFFTLFSTTMSTTAKSTVNVPSTSSESLDHSINNIPTISIKSNSLPTFLQAICDDIKIKSNKTFTPNLTPIGSGYHSNVYKLDGEEYDLCVKVFKLGLLRLTNGYNKEHNKFYNITGQKFEENFLKQLDNKELQNVSLPIVAYKSGFFFANVSKFGGSLQLSKVIKNQIILDEQTTASIIYDILKGLESLHNKNYSHNDLHPWNIVMNFKDGKYVDTNIIDCGNVYKKSNKIWDRIASFTGYKILRYLNLLTLCHIWPYINLRTGYYDPQDLKFSIVDSNSDIFSTCVIMWELLFGNCPFAGSNLKGISTSKAILNLKDSLKMLEQNKNISNPCKDLLSKLLEPTKEKRISATDALNHEFFKNKKSPLEMQVISNGLF